MDGESGGLALGNRVLAFVDDEHPLLCNKNVSVTRELDYLQKIVCGNSISCGTYTPLVDHVPEKVEAASAEGTNPNCDTIR